MPSITAHCLVKNEDRFIEYAVKSVIDFVDQVLIFDTGSTDGTVNIIKQLQLSYPSKIIFEEKGECDKKQHTQLRQEMIEKTSTDWFMIVDGDEVWTDRAMQEALAVVRNNPAIECIIAPFYLCVGDMYHQSRKGQYIIRGKKAHATPRFFRKNPGLHWSGEYNFDAVVDSAGERVFEKEAVVFLQKHFWHLSHLVRSSIGGEDFSSGTSRKNKVRLTYFIIGKKIIDTPPEVFLKTPRAAYLEPLGFFKSVENFFTLLGQKLFVR
jgi:glycosyltransferase involved in cell wall biosynthesis